MNVSFEKITDDLKNWKEIVKPYTTPEYKKAFMQILNTFPPFIALCVGACILYNYTIWGGMLLTLGAGLYLTRVFVIQHDCGHQSFMPTRKANDIVGVICSLFTLIPYKYWARTHNHHHAHQGQLDTRTIGDITLLTVGEFEKLSSWEKFKYKVYRSAPVLFVLGPLYYIFVHNRLPLISLKGWKKEKKTLIFTNFYLIGFYALLGYWIGYQKLLILYFPIVMLFASIAVWFFYIQHQHDPNYKSWKSEWDYLLAAIRGSSYYKLPKIMNFFSGNIGYHHIHHLAAKIPFYKLAKCSKENPILQKYVTTLTFWKSLKFAFYSLWDEESGRMITFRQYKRLKTQRVAA